jgi:uncharacterized protein YutE (UPF0331/DUF86 family)
VVDAQTLREILHTLVDSAIVYEHLRDRLEDFETFLRLMHEYLDRESPP